MAILHTENWFFVLWQIKGAHYLFYVGSRSDGYA